jgi:hypothetical protein
MTGEIEDRVSHLPTCALEQAIADALTASGVTDHLTAADLSPADEFHIGGRQATVEFAEQLDARPMDTPARYRQWPRRCIPLFRLRVWLTRHGHRLD